MNDIVRNERVVNKIFREHNEVLTVPLAIDLISNFTKSEMSKSIEGQQLCGAVIGICSTIFCFLFDFSSQVL